MRYFLRGLTIFSNTSLCDTVNFQVEHKPYRIYHNGTVDPQYGDVREFLKNAYN